MPASGFMLEALLDPHLADLRRFIQRRASASVRSRETCSDLVQSICRELLGHRDRYRGTGFRAWLFATARRKLADRARYHDRQRRWASRERLCEESVLETLAGPVAEPHELAVSRERLEVVRRCLAQMPPDYRRVLLLARVHNRSTEEIAMLMQRSTNAVHTLLCRAQARLILLAGDSDT